MLEVTMPAGTDQAITITVTAKNLAGAVAQWTLVTSHGLTPVLTKKTSDAGITIVGATNSTVTVNLVGADTATIAPGHYEWQLCVRLGTVQEIIDEGSLILEANDYAEEV